LDNTSKIDNFEFFFFQNTLEPPRVKNQALVSIHEKSVVKKYLHPKSGCGFRANLIVPFKIFILGI